MNFLEIKNFSWFVPYIKEYLCVNFLDEKKLFRLSTEEIAKKISNKEIFSLVLVERFLIENIKNGFYSSKLINLVLEKRKVPGYLFLFSIKNKNEQIPLIKLFENIYFYPIEWNNISQLFFNFWKKGTDFIGVYKILKKGYTLEEIKKYFELPLLFNFTRFSEKTSKELLKFLPDLNIEKLKEINQQFLIRNNSFLILTSSNLENKNLPGKIIYKINGKNKLILIENKNIDDLKQFFKNSNGKTGILPKYIFKEFENFGFSPLTLVLGAFEHVKRLFKEKVITFEGFTYHVLGDLYYEWGDLGSALKCYTYAEKYTKQPTELALSKASVFYTLGELKTAEKILKSELCGCKKENPMVHYNLGLVYLKEQKPEKAEYHFYKAYLLEPENEIYRKTLIKYLWDSERYEEIEEILNSALTLTYEEKIYLGKLYFIKRDYKKALEYLRKIFNNPERDGESLLFLAWLYKHFKKEKEVYEIFIKEAKNKLSSEKFKKIINKINLELE